MRYIAVEWHHENSEDPVEIFSEIDEAGWERRKIECYADGRIDYAAKDMGTGSTRLGEYPIPPLAEIARDPQFEPRAITLDEFEIIWKRAKDS